MDKWLQQRAELIRNAKSLIDERETANKSLSQEDRTRLKSWSDQVDALDAKIEAARRDAPLAAQFRAQRSGPETPGGDRSEQMAGDRIEGAFRPEAVRDLADRLARKSMPTDPDSAKAFDLTNATDVVVTELSAKPQRPTSLLDVLEVKRVSTPTFRFFQQTERLNKAAVVGTGELKPTSNYALEGRDRALKVIAHLSDPVDKYLVSDVSSVAEFLSHEMQYGLNLAVEAEALNGDGTDSHLHGIMTQSGVLIQEHVTDAITTARQALLQLEVQGFAPRAIVVRPEVWAAIELAQTSGSGEYVLTNSPVDRAEARLWGCQVVQSTALAEGDGLVLAEGAVRLYTDGAVQAEWGITGDDFARNQARLRVESRFEVGVVHPQGVVKFATASE